jgi:hypothetical protein
MSSEFPIVDLNGAGKIPDEMFGAFLRAEAKLARENHRYARSFFDNIVSVSKILNRASGVLVTPEYRNELIKLATAGLNEIAVAGFHEIDIPDMSIYPDGS